VITLEDGKKTRLSACGAFDTPELAKKPDSRLLEIVKIIKQIRNPETRTLSDCDELGWLAMGVSKAWQFAKLHSKGTESLDYARELR
jgi:hypothetical protein